METFTLSPDSFFDEKVANVDSSYTHSFFCSTAISYLPALGLVNDLHSSEKCLFFPSLNQIRSIAGQGNRSWLLPPHIGHNDRIVKHFSFFVLSESLWYTLPGNGQKTFQGKLKMHSFPRFSQHHLAIAPYHKQLVDPKYYSLTDAVAHNLRKFQL